MALADTNRTVIRSKAESTWGTAATGNYQIDRITGESLVHDKSTVESAELRTDRQVSYVAEVGASSTGGINMELSYGTYDAWLEHLLASTWTAPGGGARQVMSVTVANPSTGTIAATNIGVGIVVGQWVRLDGMTTPANDGFYLVKTVATSLLTVTQTFATPEGPIASVGVSATRLRNGTTETSMTIEKEFTDVTTKKFMLYTGMVPATLALTIAEGAVIGGAWTFMGKEGAVAAATAAGTPVAATTTDVINATSNVGAIYEGYPIASRAVLSTALQSVNFTIDGSLRTQRAIANRTAVGVGYGRFRVTGAVNAYFSDGNLLEKYVLHTASSLSLPVHDGATGLTAAATLANRVAGNTYIFTMPRILFAQGSAATATGTDADVFANLNFQAPLDPETGVTVQIDRFAATP